MNTKVIKIGVLLWALGAVLAFIFIAISAHGQTETCPYGYYLASNGLCYQAHGQTDNAMINQLVRTQNASMINELSHYDDLIAAFANACDTAIHNAINNQGNMTTLQKCYEIINLEHDVLTPFINIEKDNMSKIIAES